MGFRFFRRKKLFPGVTLNISKSGPSLSFGIKGARITVGTKGVRETVGLPGTGLSYTEQTSYKKDDVARPGGSGSGAGLFLLLFLACVFYLFVHFF